MLESYFHLFLPKIIELVAMLFLNVSSQTVVEFQSNFYFSMKLS